MNDEENPFRILGIPVQIAMMLTPGELRTFVNDIGKSLRKLLHPDRNPEGDEKIRIMNSALDQLKDETFFMVFWHDFVSNPIPQAAKKEKRISELQSRLSSATRKIAQLEKRCNELATNLADRDSELERLKEVGRQHLERMRVQTDEYRLKIFEQLDGKEIEYAPLVEGEPGNHHDLVYIVDAVAVKLSKEGADRRVGPVIGSIRREDFAQIVDAKNNGLIPLYGLDLKNLMASLLVGEIEEGNGLVIRSGDRIWVLGAIEEIRDSTYLETKKERMDEKRSRRVERSKKLREEEEKRKELKKDKARFDSFVTAIKLSRKEQPTAPEKFIGIVESGDRYAVRHGVIRIHSAGNQWQMAERLIGSVDAKVIARFLSSVKGLEEATRRRATVEFLEKCAMNNDFVIGNMLIGIKRRLPRILGPITECRVVSPEFIVEKFVGILTTGTDSEPEYIFADEGWVKRIEDGKEIPMGMIIASIDAGGLRVPWVEERSTAVCQPVRSREEFHVEISGIQSFKGVKKTKREEIKKKILEKSRIKA